MKIGFFDSGLGGLTIFKKAINKINADYIYLADNKNAPYGTDTKENVRKNVIENVDKLVKKGCKIIVIACNTATSVAIKDLREIYKDICIIGTEPAVKVATNENHLKKNILVSATTMTLSEEKLDNLIRNLNAQDIVQKVALDKLVKFAESGETDMDKIKEYLREQFKNYDLNKFSHIVLGCTHFPLYKEQIKEVVPKNIHIVDGSDGVVKNMCKKIDEYGLKTCDKTSIELLLTKPSSIFVNNFKRILEIDKFKIL